MCFSQQEDPPLITVGNGQKIKFEQFLFSSLNSDSVKMRVDSLCCAIAVFVKFEVNQGKFSNIAYSPETPILLRKIITELILETTPFWKDVRKTKYILPLSISLVNSECSKTKKDLREDLGITRRAVLAIQDDKDEYDFKNLLMKHERFKGVILHPVSMSKTSTECFKE